MTEHERAFLADILEHPLDDTPRLVMADWLEENAGTTPCPLCAGKGGNIHVGVERVFELNSPANAMSYEEYKADAGIGWRESHETRWHKCMACEQYKGVLPDGRAARAEFIRCQIGLANLSACEWEKEDGSPCPQYNANRPKYRVQVYCPTCAKGERLKTRGKQLLEQHRQEWMPAWIWPFQPKRCVFRRGFIEEMLLHWWELQDHHKEIGVRYPVKVLRMLDHLGEARENPAIGLHLMDGKWESDLLPGVEVVSFQGRVGLFTQAVMSFQLGSQVEVAIGQVVKLASGVQGRLLELPDEQGYARVQLVDQEEN